MARPSGSSLGLTFFFAQFYNALVIEGFPYFLSWCHGGMSMISAIVIGTVIGAIYR